MLDRAVLSPARWTMRADEIRAIAQSAADERVAAFDTWRAERQVPRYIVLSDGDNRLAVDSENVLNVDAFIRLIRGRAIAVLEEMMPAPDELCVRGPEGRFTNEIILPLIAAGSASPVERQAEAPGPRTAKEPRASPSVIRQHAPGGEWLYAKLYCGAASADFVARTIIAPLVDRATEERWIDKWFFLRYADPRFHIRIRFHGESGAMLRTLQLLGQACARSIASGRLSRLVLDTYRPEVERYGGPAGLDAAESIFHADSHTALGFIHGLADTGGRVASFGRDLVTLAGIDRYFQDANCALVDRIRLLELLLKDQPRERRRLRSGMFREYRQRIGDCLEEARHGCASSSQVAHALCRRSDQTRAAFEALSGLQDRGELVTPFDDILFSCTHMWTNRMSSPASTFDEVTLYDFLYRCYVSEHARAEASAAHHSVI
jgi:thiopeptide-type bacteriocin biosynthesis protein